MMNQNVNPASTSAAAPPPKPNTSGDRNRSSSPGRRGFEPTRVFTRSIDERESSRGGVEARRIPKLAEGRPNIIDLIKNREVHLIINTPTRKGPQTDEGKIRATSVLNKVPLMTTLTGASAAVKAIAALQKDDWDVAPLQSYHEG